MPWMSDFANDQHVERPLQQPRHFRGNHDTAARQPQHQVGLHVLLTQKFSQAAPRILTRCEFHKTSIILFGGKINSQAKEQ